MTAFADACALIVYFGERGAGMSAAGRALMRTGELTVSAITVWEISRKLRAGRLPPVPREWADDLTGWLRDEGFAMAALSPEHAELSNALPPHHADPMDRMLIAAALSAGAPVVTMDRIFEAYGVEVIW